MPKRTKCVCMWIYVLLLLCLMTYLENVHSVVDGKRGEGGGWVALLPTIMVIPPHAVGPLPCNFVRDVPFLQVQFCTFCQPENCFLFDAVSRPWLDSMLIYTNGLKSTYNSLGLGFFMPLQLYMHAIWSVYCLYFSLI